MTEDIQLSTHFRDLIDTKHVVADNDRLPGPDGTPGTGMKIREAIPLSEYWWEQTGRFCMPDYGKPAEQMVVKSGILMGLPYMKLDKQERIRVLAQWYAHIGVHTIIADKGTSMDNIKADMFDKIRKDATRVFGILSNKGTHVETSDALETETWKDGYEEIEQADTLVDGRGDKLN